MKKNVTVMIVLFCLSFCVFADTTVSISLLNGTEKSITVNDDVDEIYGVKTYLYFKKDGKVIKEYNHTSPLQKLEGIEKLINIRKVSLFMELSDFLNFPVFASLPIKEMYISYGLDEKAFIEVQKMFDLRTLYFTSMRINEIKNIDLSKTQIEYLEVSYSELKEVSNCLLPESLKYLNIIGNGKVKFDQKTIDEINRNNTILFSDTEVEGIKAQYTGTEKYSKIPKVYNDIGP